MNRVACSTSTRSEVPLEVALADIAAAGFREVDILAIDGWAHIDTSQLATEAGFRSAVQRTDTLLNAYGLAPIAVNGGVGPQLHDRSAEANERRLRETRGLVRWMSEFAIPFAAVQPRLPDPGRPWEDVLRDCAATLREQLDIAAAAGVTFGLEFHDNSPFMTMAQCRRLLETVPELPIVYDPSHFILQGVPLEATFPFLDRAAHVHLRDAAAEQMQTRFGRGELDFDALFAELGRRRYEGDFSIEYLQTEEYDALEDARLLREAIGRYYP